MTAVRRLDWWRLPLQLVVAATSSAALAQFVPSLPCRVLTGIGAGALVLAAFRRYGRPAEPNHVVRRTSLAVVGLGIGTLISAGAAADAVRQLPLYLAVALGMIAIGVALGYLYRRAAGLDLLSGLLAMSPGGLAAMTGAAAERGRDVATVSAVQTLRLIASLFLVVAVVGIPAIGGSPRAQPLWGDLRLETAFALVGALVLVWPLSHVGRRFGVPLPTYFAGMVGGLALTLLTETSIPLVVTAAGQLLLGISVGESVIAGLRHATRTVLTGALGVVVTLGAGLVAAVVVHAATGLDWLTCVLMTAPGGAPEITMFTLTLPVHVESVALAQLVRQLLINLGLPLWMWLFTRLDRQRR